LRSISPSASDVFPECSPDAGYGRDQELSVISFDFVEADEHAGVRSLLDGTDVGFNLLVARMLRPLAAIRSSPSSELKRLPGWA
jgi:hypothetical protein